MVNVDFGPGTVLGLGLIAGGYLLVQARALKPELSRDLDIFLSSVVMMSGGILVFQGWRLDPILFFAQASVVAVALTFALEAFKLREVEFMQEEQERKRIARSRRRTAAAGSGGGFGARALPEDDSGGYDREYFVNNMDSSSSSSSSPTSWPGRQTYEYEGSSWADNLSSSSSSSSSAMGGPRWEGRDQGDSPAQGGQEDDSEDDRGFAFDEVDPGEEEDFWSRFEDDDDDGRGQGTDNDWD